MYIHYIFYLSNFFNEQTKAACPAENKCWPQKKKAHPNKTIPNKNGLKQGTACMG